MKTFTTVSHVTLTHPIEVTVSIPNNLPQVKKEFKGQYNRPSTETGYRTEGGVAIPKRK